MIMWVEDFSVTVRMPNGRNLIMRRCFLTMPCSFPHYLEPRYNPKEIRRVTSDTIAWLNKEMGTPRTGYASSMSSESDGVEGDCYEWSEQELREILGDDHGKAFMRSFLPYPIEKVKLPQLISLNPSLKSNNSNGYPY